VLVSTSAGGIYPTKQYCTFDVPTNLRVQMGWDLACFYATKGFNKALNCIWFNKNLTVVI